MSETGFFIFLAAIIGVAVLGAVIAVIAAVSGASAAIADEEDSAEDVFSLKKYKAFGFPLVKYGFISL